MAAILRARFFSSDRKMVFRLEVQAVNGKKFHRCPSPPGCALEAESGVTVQENEAVASLTGRSAQSAPQKNHQLVGKSESVLSTANILRHVRPVGPHASTFE